MTSEEPGFPLCVFGLESDSPGSIWFMTAEGVDPLHQRPGPEYEPYSRYGFAVRLGADLDADGVPDLIVSAPGSMDDPGKVFLVSTRTRAVLRELCSPGRAMRFGTGLCAVPDLDGDGVEDLAVVAEERISGTRYGAFMSVFVLSTVTGEVLQKPLEHIRSSAYGRPQLEWLVDTTSVEGGLLLFSSPRAVSDGLVALDLHGRRRAWSQGIPGRFSNEDWSLDVIPDLDGDGMDEALIGDMEHYRHMDEDRHEYRDGRLRVASGRTGKLLRLVDGVLASHDSGLSVARGDDWDGDGTGDFLITSPWGFMDGGSLLIVSGKDCEPQHLLKLSGGFFAIGHAMEVGADWDGKGMRDLCVSAYTPTAGCQDYSAAIGIISMEDGALLHYVNAADVEELIWKRDHAD